VEVPTLLQVVVSLILAAAVAHAIWKLRIFVVELDWNDNLLEERRCYGQRYGNSPIFPGILFVVVLSVLIWQRRRPRSL